MSSLMFLHLSHFLLFILSLKNHVDLPFFHLQIEQFQCCARILQRTMTRFCVHLNVHVEENFSQCLQPTANVWTTGEIEQEGSVNAKS
jgi:hypothetical protein